VKNKPAATKVAASVSVAASTDVSPLIKTTTTGGVMCPAGNSEIVSIDDFSSIVHNTKTIKPSIIFIKQPTDVVSPIMTIDENKKPIETVVTIDRFSRSPNQRVQNSYQGTLLSELFTLNGQVKEHLNISGRRIYTTIDN